MSVVAASITTRGSTAVDVFKITDGATGGKVSSEKFELLRRGVAHRARRQAISQSLGHAPLGGLASSPPAVPPSAEELAVVDAACLALPPFTPLLTAERHDIYAQMHRLAFISGELLLLEGTEVQQFFVVQSGDVRGCGSGRTLRCGDVLGELGIVQTALSQDSWRAGAAGCVVSVVDRRKLHALLHSAAGQRRARAASALQELPMLEGLTKGQLYTLVDCMRRCELPQGAPLSHAFLHILLRGQVQLSDRGALHRGAESGEEEEPAGPLAAPVLARVGDAFGEAACLANGASPAGIAIATVSKVEVMWCDRDTFVRVLGPPEHLLLPGTVRKVSPQRTAAAPTLLPPGGAGASLALGGDAIAEEDELMLEEEEEHAPPVPRPMASQAVQVSAFRPLAAAPADRQTDTAAVDAVDEALVAAALASAAGPGGVNRFRTPNQDVSWHGRSAALEALQSSAGPCSQDGLRSTLSSSRRLSSSLAQHAAPLALAAASQPSAAITRACSAPAALSNIAGGTPSPGGGALVPKGAWRLSLALGDFLLGSKLGEGLTGRVHYAQLKVRGVECALKIMRKAKLIELGEEHHVRSELEALGRIGSPFVTQLLGCFQDKHAVYLAIEYMRGPDLFAYMHEINAPAGFERSVPIAAVRFYTAQVLLGLDALHSNGYVYRDLKPENILMDGSGNLKLADLGFAKLVFEGGRAYTVCGTPDYLAPEVIEHRGATRGSDYWALGILIFEFIAGCALQRAQPPPCPHARRLPASRPSRGSPSGTNSRRSARAASSTGRSGSLKSAPAHTHSAALWAHSSPHAVRTKSCARCCTRTSPGVWVCWRAVWVTSRRTPFTRSWTGTASSTTPRSRPSALASTSGARPPPRPRTARGCWGSCIRWCKETHSSQRQRRTSSTATASSTSRDIAIYFHSFWFASPQLAPTARGSALVLVVVQATRPGDASSIAPPFHTLMQRLNVSERRVRHTCIAEYGGRRRCGRGDCWESFRRHPRLPACEPLR